MKNEDIRRKAGGYGIPLWMIAEKMKISDSSFSRKLRHELKPEEKERILNLIDEIFEEREGIRK